MYRTSFYIMARATPQQLLHSYCPCPIAMLASHAHKDCPAMQRLGAADAATALMLCFCPIC